MQPITLIVASLLVLPTITAHAAVKVINKDSSAHEVTLKCSSTADTSIAGSSTRDIGNGPCTVTVKKSGSSATASGNETLTIKDGKISK